MKKSLQFFAVTLMAMFIFTNLGFAQLAENSNVKPAQVELSSKDADLLWGANWQDPATTTSGIVSTLFGGLNDPGPGYVVTADDIIVPDGKAWTITSIWARGFYSVDADTGDPWAEADGFGVRIYADDNDTPGDLVIDHLVQLPGMDATAPQVDFSTPLELTAGKYWVAVYGYFETSSASNEGRWNQYTWNPDPPVESKAKLRDYADLFGMADSGWMILEDDLNIAVTALDFAVWGTEADDGTTVVDIIVGSDDHTTLATAVTLAGLVEALSGTGPFTVFAPTNDAFDALPAGLLDDLLADPDGALTNVLLYHVVEGNVLSTDLTDGQTITTMLGQELTVTIDGGVFINDVSGNSVQVTAPDLLADNGVVHVVDGVLIPDLTVQMFDVTFIVDMTDAVALGDVAFDPEIHRVFLSGTFAGWAEPGSDDQFELLPMVDTKDAHMEMLYPGNWTDETEGAMGAWSAGGYIFGTNVYDDGAYAQIFEIDEEYHIHSAKFWIGSAIGGTGDVVFTVWDYSGGSVGDVLGAKTIPLADIMESETFDNAFMVNFDEPVHVTGDFLIGADISGLDEYEEDVYELGNVHSDDGGGGAGLALVLEGATWVAVLDYGVDVDLAIFPFVTAGDPDPDPDPVTPFYTLTLAIEEGTQEYKYFLVVDEPTWNLGEKEGTDNRVVEITEDVTFEDIWGDFGVFVENVLSENSLNIFPNPVRNTLYVENSELINDLRIFDLTGRLIFSQVVNDNATSVNVSMFNTGVYIMQVMTVNGVVSKKFSVQ